jgi:hypothetical protein
MVHIASSQRSRVDETEYGWIDTMSCIILFYPNFDVFIVLDPMEILVFCLVLQIGLNGVGATKHFFNFHMHFLD